MTRARADVDRLARAWIALQRNWWAHGELGDLCASSPVEAWQVLVRLAVLCDSDELTEDLGAGPLEDFIRFHAPTYIDAIDDLARQNAAFRTALQHVLLPDAGDPISKRLFALGVRPVSADRAPWQAA
jgi:hypothetical protein